MKVWDGCSQASISFASPDPAQPLNYIVENDVTQAALDAAMAQCGNLSVLYGSKVEGYRLPQNEEGQPLDRESVKINLQGGDSIETSLLVGADGFRSVQASVGDPVGPGHFCRIRSRYGIFFPTTSPGSGSGSDLDN